jgi:hypothetical protein
MTIPHTAIAIDGNTAWLVMDEPDHDETMRWANLDRPCDTCDGVECSMGWDCDDTLCQCPCLHCHGTGRHTFTLDVECEWCVGYGYLLGAPDHYEAGSDAVIPCTDDDGEECNDGTRQLTVHVVAVLPIADEFDDGCDALPSIELRGDGSYWLYDQDWVSDLGSSVKPTAVALPVSAAPGKYAVQLEVHA